MQERETIETWAKKTKNGYIQNIMLFNMQNSLSNTNKFDSIFARLHKLYHPREKPTQTSLKGSGSAIKI